MQGRELSQKFPGLDAGAVQQTIEKLLATARAQWPQLKVADATFVDRLAAQFPAEGTIEALAGIHAADLYLACACGESQPAALEAFERAFLPAIAAQLKRQSGRADFVTEACQVIRLRLFFSMNEQAPKIATYTGRGPLAGWLRVVASRAALNLRRDDPASDEQPVDERTARSTGDPELGFLKKKLGAEVEVVLDAALATLAAEERAVLKHYFLDGMTVREIGKLYDVNASTITRWIASTRARILSEMRTLIAQKLALPSQEADSLMRFAQSQLEFSLRRALS